MGEGQSKGTVEEFTSDETKTANFLLEMFTKEGPSAIEKHVRETLNNWQNESVNIGVLGRYKTGKSTFINAVLGLKPGQSGAAKSGSGNTTCRVEHYQHPNNSQITLSDFPGVDTPEFPRQTYLENVKTSECDYFLIFFDAVISEDAIWLAKNLLKINKPFCFVRSMIDQDIANASYDGKNSSEVLAEIRERAAKTLSQNDLINYSSSIFFISGRHTNIGEFEKLLNHIETNLSPLKLQAFVFSIKNLARDVIEKKYRQLKARVKTVSLGAAAISAIPLPGVDLVLNMALITNEMKHCIKTFNFDKYKDLPPDTKRNIKLGSVIEGRIIPFHNFLIGQLGKATALMEVESVADSFLPLIGAFVSSVTTLIVVYKFLNKFLKNCRHDALIIYDYIIETQTDINK